MKGVHDHFEDLVLAYDSFMARLARADVDVYRFDFTEDPEYKRAIPRVARHWEEYLG
jgi:hypothetical protein